MSIGICPNCKREVELGNREKGVCPYCKTAIQTASSASNEAFMNAAGKVTEKTGNIVFTLCWYVFIYGFFGFIFNFVNAIKCFKNKLVPLGIGSILCAVGQIAGMALSSQGVWAWGIVLVAIVAGIILVKITRSEIQIIKQIAAAEAEPEPKEA
jgi:hypothetical protein